LLTYFIKIKSQVPTTIHMSGLPSSIEAQISAPQQSLSDEQRASFFRHFPPNKKIWNILLTIFKRII
jgi:hypothetical protein